MHTKIMGRPPLTASQVFAEVADFPPVKRRGTGSIKSVLGGKKRSCSGDAERGRRLHLDACFSCFDVLERGRVPSGVVWGGLALMTGAGEFGKIKFVLSMYDADRYIPSFSVFSFVTVATTQYGTTCRHARVVWWHKCELLDQKDAYSISGGCI